MRDFVTVGMATIPGRERALHLALDSLYRQVDQINLVLNGFDEAFRLPNELLDLRKIRILRSQDVGDCGDAGKMMRAHDARGYYFACDDDLIYPPDYVARMIEAIECYQRQAIVGVHGVLLNDNPQRYYGDRTTHHFGRELAEDCPCHILGTGCCAWHADTILIHVDEFKTPNMADVWLGVLAQRARVPMITIRRRAEWIKQGPINLAETIFEKHKHDDRAQSELMRSVKPWRLYPMTRFDAESYWQRRHTQFRGDLRSVGCMGMSHAQLAEGFVRAERYLGEVLDAEDACARSVLDFGCGVGRLAPFFLQRGLAYTGLDFSKTAIEEARKLELSPDDASFYVDGPDEPLSRLSQFDLKLAHFDLVIAWSVLLHIIDDASWSRTLRRLTDVLSFGGRLVIVDTIPEDPWDERDLAEHVRFRTREAYERELVRCGCTLRIVGQDPTFGLHVAIVEKR